MKAYVYGRKDDLGHMKVHGVSTEPPTDPWYVEVFEFDTDLDTFMGMKIGVGQ
jgi:hypothetical protein